MTRAATVVRRNDQLSQAYDEVCRLEDLWRHCSLSDTGNWTNQNVVFTKSLGDMFPIAKLILKGALLRDEAVHPSTLAGLGTILVGVALVLFAPRGRGRP